MDQHEASEIISQMSKPIKWVIPDSIRTDHATHLVVQQQGSEFTLLFFELQAPVMMGTPEEQIEAFKEIPFAEAKCIARIVMSPETIAQVTSNLVDAFSRFEAMLLAATKGQENADDSEPSRKATTSGTSA